MGTRLILNLREAYYFPEQDDGGAVTEPEDIVMALRALPRPSDSLDWRTRPRALLRNKRSLLVNRPETPARTNAAYTARLSEGTATHGQWRWDERNGQLDPNSTSEVDLTAAAGDN